MKINCDGQSTIFLEKILISLATSFDMEIEKMDVKTTFLHGDLEEEIYMKQLEGFVVKGKKYLVCKFKRSFYGLKQSPRMWYKTFDTYILSFGFVRSKVYHYIYYKKEGGCCWLWSLIIFLFHRYLFSTMFIPHEYCTPHNIHTRPCRGVAGGDFPPYEVQGAHSPGWGGPGESEPPMGFRGTMFPDGILGAKALKENFPCKCIL
jgi:hypothetical protein